MAQEFQTIDKYSLSRLTNFSNVRAVIWLFSGGKTVARLEFRATDVPTKLTVHQYPTGEVLWIYFPIEAYPDIVDLLRHEGPVILTYDKQVGYARLETGEEPVGEGENAT